MLYIFYKISLPCSSFSAILQNNFCTKVLRPRTFFKITIYKWLKNMYLTNFRQHFFLVCWNLLNFLFKFCLNFGPKFPKFVQLKNAWDQDISKTETIFKIPWNSGALQNYKYSRDLPRHLWLNCCLIYLFFSAQVRSWNWKRSTKSSRIVPFHQMRMDLLHMEVSHT